MIPRLYKHNETKFNHNGEGLLKDIIKCRVVHERNGQYDLELEYKSKSRLSDKIIKGNLIKADAGKRFKNQLFRVYNIKKSLNNTIIAYANHISFDLRNNFIPIVNLKNVSCMTALNTMAKSMALENSFIFETDITHSADFTVERVDVLSALGGIRGSIIDTFGNGANIVRDNFKISILQNVGYDNNILISYKKNLLDLNFEDGKEVITGIYPYVQFSEGINSETQINKEILELPEKYLYIEGHENAKVKKVIGVDFSENKDINTVDKLREAGNKYLKNLAKDMPSIKVKFVDKENLNEFENVSQLQTLDLYDTVIVRYILLGINYKTKINKVVYDVLKEEYEEIELGEKRTNLASSLNDKDKNIKDEIKNNIDFVKQVIEHATSQITGNSGGHVMLWPPDKPSEIFFMDTDNPNTARNVLRINREGIGFSNNGINGPFRTAWTSDGSFYADFITAGILTAISIQNADGSLQIDLSGTNGINFLKNGVRAIEIAGSIMRFFDWDGIGEPIAEIFSSRLGGDENRPGLTIGNTKEGCISIGYRDENNPKTYPKYMLFDIHNLSGEAPYPIMMNKPVCFDVELVLGRDGLNEMYTSIGKDFINKVTNSWGVVNKSNGFWKMKNGHDETFFAKDGYKYASFKPGILEFWDSNRNGYFFVSNLGNLVSKLKFFADNGMVVNNDLQVYGNKNCIQKTEKYGDRNFYSVEDCESYLTDRSMHLMTVEKVQHGDKVSYERVILLDNVFKDSVNLDLDYTVEINKQGPGDFWIKEQTKDYFVVESDRPDFTFKYVITAKRKGFEDERNKEVFLDTETYSLNENNSSGDVSVNNDLNINDINNLPNPINNEYWRLYTKNKIAGDSK
ncbi:Gp14 protein,Phage-related protein,phage minor structural protein, N-terminal region [[Clostridium] sordellii]|uniref:phage tail spike protein n=2 Tax=Paraclostridium sordellii TaxID=1505 RepID=UPI000543FEF6|nr:phage tail spike protein [Paeniclostridium sordellii]CEK35774.1 Gp14 protein,Phage-related protein,phage minor structural protein, N-terminal region [[Clostridium] sordellii] [Paeniclostridium sordellii]